MLKLRYCEKATQFEKYPPYLDIHWANNKTSERLFFSISYSLFRKPELEMGENYYSNNKSPVLFLLICLTRMVLGVLCNVFISKDCSGSFVGCGKIFDFGILWTICLKISFLMIITIEPINVMYMHMAARILSFLKEFKIRPIFY